MLLFLQGKKMHYIFDEIRAIMHIFYMQMAFFIDGTEKQFYFYVLVYRRQSDDNVWLCESVKQGSKS